MDSPFRKTFTKASLDHNEECLALCMKEFSQVRNIVFADDDDTGEYRVCEIVYADDDPDLMNDTLLHATRKTIEGIFDTVIEDQAIYKASKTDRMVRFFYTIEKAPNF